MKLLVSDFDGTFYIDKRYFFVLANKNQIENYRDENHLFTFASGRTYKSLKQELNIYGIPYDYIICSDGACVFNNKNELINLIKPSIKSKIEAYKYLRSLPFVYKLYLLDCYGNVTDNLEDAIQIIYNVNIERIRDMKLTDIDNFNKFNVFNTFVLQGNITKKDGIEYLRNKLNINKDDIYTIGDETNDLEMLKEYNGYRVLLSNPKLIKEKIPVSNVRRLARKLRG